MKLSDFLQDTLPVSKGSVKIPIKGMITDYRNRYNAMIKEKANFKLTSYTIRVNNRHIIHVKVPSETVDRFYYDVLLEFTPTSKTHSFEECDIQIFSNSPSFVYRYAYVFYHLSGDLSKRGENTSKNTVLDIYKQKIPRDRLLTPGMEKKLGEEVLTQEPVVRNSLGLPLFDKTVYYAIFYLLDHYRYGDMIMVRRYITMKQLSDAIPSFDKLMMDRKSMAAKQKEKERRHQVDIQKDYEKQEQYVNRKSSGVRRIKPVTSTNRVNKITPVKSKGVNKIGKK